MIYLDNAATSLKKPSCVIKEVNNCLKNYCANPGRGGHKLSLLAAQKVYECREKLAKLFKIKNTQNIIFTSNATDGLNTVIKGVLKAGDHVIITGLEHNSVLRPVNTLLNKSVSYSILEADEKGIVSSTALEKLFMPNTRLVIATHASNVCGNILPIDEIIKATHKHNALFLLDAAQTVGVVDIDVESQNIDLMVFSGHKSLLGLQGSGGLFIRNGEIVNTLKEGGTGTMSELMTQPEDMPDKFESGTLNTPGIVGLCEGVKFILRNGVQNILLHELELAYYFNNELKNINNITIYGCDDFSSRTPVIAFNIRNLHSIAVANELSEKYDIAVRGGLHCSYLCHKALGTLQTGAVRVSFGYFNDIKNAQKALDAINKIQKGC